MQTLIQDLRFALRQIRHSPGFMLTAVLTLALGVGANTAIFSLLDQALLRSLPVLDPGQLVVLSDSVKVWEGHISNNGEGADQSFSYLMYRDLRDKGTAFDGLIATSSTGVGIMRNHTSEHADAEIVSGNYFNVLGVEPALGRLLTQGDDTLPGANPVAVLSYNYWNTKLGADPSVIGQTFSINGHPYQIIGVAPAQFQSAVWGEVPDLFVPMSMLGQVSPSVGDWLEDRTDRWVSIVGRLKPGETRAHAQMELAPLWHALRAEEFKGMHDHVLTPRFAGEFLGSHLDLLPGSRGLSYSRGDLQKPLLVVMAMALLVLLMASVNVASLLIVRSAGRVREFSVRYALGASARRVVQQLLLEGLMIGILGGATGLLLAPACIRILVQRLDPEGPSAFHTTLDARLLLFNFAVAILVSVFFSLAPALQLLKPDVVSSLKQQTTTAAGATLSLRGFIVALQIGLSVLLLVSAGLFVRTMQNLRRVDTGINPSHLVTFRLNPQLSGYTVEQTPAVQQHVLDTMAALPGIEAVGATNDQELADSGRNGDVPVEGHPLPPDVDYDVEKSSISPGYFRALQVPLLVGRPFTEDDDATRPLVAIVNETFARHFFGNPATAIGHRISYGQGPPQKWMEIVGVARDAHHANLREPVLPTAFTPIKQVPVSTTGRLFLYVRTALPPEQAFATIRQGMRQIDSSLTIDPMRTMDDQIDTTLSNEHMIELLAISFGLLATLLAGVGLYGVLAYSTAQRTREIGIRIALGSTRFAVSRLVLADVLRLAGIGIVVAIPCSILLAKLLQSQLFGVSTTDPLVLAAVVLAITVVALVAAIVPARRASTVDPTTALRAE
jgi:putative ABC transport system permease protein